MRKIMRGPQYLVCVCPVDLIPDRVSHQHPGWPCYFPVILLKSCSWFWTETGLWILWPSVPSETLGRQSTHHPLDSLSPGKGSGQCQHSLHPQFILFFTLQPKQVSLTILHVTLSIPLKKTQNTQKKNMSWSCPSPHPQGKLRFLMNQDKMKTKSNVISSLNPLQSHADHVHHRKLAPPS